jgi:hypothetical protein
MPKDEWDTTPAFDRQMKKCRSRYGTIIFDGVSKGKYIVKMGAIPCGNK